MSPNDTWNAALYKAIQAARLGREVLMHYFGRLENIQEKHLAGLVSEADKESEKVIANYLLEQFPEDVFLGEESTLDQQLEKEAQITPKKGRWIVDPLDGTTNYVHRFPIFCVSIGYEFQGKLQLSVIDVPVLGEVYTAIRGQGAFVNGKKMTVSQTEKLSDSFLATGFVPYNLPILEDQIKIFSKLVKESRGIRRAGSAAYDLCQVARGVFDGYWEKNLKPWDCAGGQLLVEEAGGVVMTYSGGSFNPFKESMIAGNKVIVQEIQRTIQSLQIK